MSRSVQTDTEKKIAEIRKSAEETRKTKGSWVDGQDYADDVEFLLNELERLREERDKLIEGLRWYADEDTHELKRRPDGDYIPIVLDHGKRARKILKQIGVNVE